MHHQEPGDPTRREHHHGDEDQPEIKLPYLRQIAETKRQQRDKNGADNRSDKESDPADISGEQYGSRLLRAEISRVGDLEIDGRECASYPCEKAGKAERKIADDVWIIADELDAFWVIAHRIAHAPERGTRQRVHRNHGNQRPCSYKIINLDLRAETPAEQFQQFGPVGGDACFAP